MIVRYCNGNDDDNACSQYYASVCIVVGVICHSVMYLSLKCVCMEGICNVIKF